MVQALPSRLSWGPLLLFSQHFSFFLPSNYSTSNSNLPRVNLKWSGPLKSTTDPGVRRDPSSPRRTTTSQMVTTTPRQARYWPMQSSISRQITIWWPPATGLEEIRVGWSTLSGRGSTSPCPGRKKRMIFLPWKVPSSPSGQRREQKMSIRPSRYILL